MHITWFVDFASLKLYVVFAKFLFYISTYYIVRYQLLCIILRITSSVVAGGAACVVHGHSFEYLAGAMIAYLIIQKAHVWGMPWQDFCVYLCSSGSLFTSFWITTVYILLINYSNTVYTCNFALLFQLGISYFTTDWSAHVVQSELCIYIAVLKWYDTVMRTHCNMVVIHS